MGSKIRAILDIFAVHGILPWRETQILLSDSGVQCSHATYVSAKNTTLRIAPLHLAPGDAAKFAAFCAAVEEIGGIEEAERLLVVIKALKTV
jgi:hypothetical protein